MRGYFLGLAGLGLAVLCWTCLPATAQQFDASAEASSATSDGLILDVPLLEEYIRENGVIPSEECGEFEEALPASRPYLAPFANELGDQLQTAFAPCSATLIDQLKDLEQEYCDPRLTSTMICGPRTPPIVWPPKQSPKSLRDNEEGAVSLDESPQSFQYVVALMDDDGMVQCSGILVDDHRILTAGHCVCPERDALITGFIGTNTYDRVGFSQDLDLGEADDFDSFCKDKQSDTAVDLGIVEYTTRTPIDPWFFADFGPAPFPLSGQAVGFGASPDNLSGGVKGDVSIPLSRCRTSDGTGCRPLIEFVSVNPPDFYGDTCYGDSGGPVISGEKVIGVTSRRVANSEATYCGSGGIYVSLIPEQNARYAEIRAWLFP